jgi:hypothetical protein
MRAVEKHGYAEATSPEYERHLDRIMPWTNVSGEENGRVIPGVRNRFGKVTKRFRNGRWESA